jgi:hypothetical protein
LSASQHLTCAAQMLLALHKFWKRWPQCIHLHLHEGHDPFCRCVSYRYVFSHHGLAAANVLGQLPG